MNVRLCTISSIAALTALLLAGGSVAANAAAAPKIASSSCGGVPVTASGNAFCSFETDGSGVVIGHGSCTVPGACLLLGNGVRIGNGSCNGDTACTEIGSVAGVSVIGNDSCNGDFACWAAGAAGASDIGDKSCNGPAAQGPFEIVGVCTGVGLLGGNVRIGSNSCNDGAFACLFAAAGPAGSFVVGNNSCSGRRACTFVGQNGGIGIVGNNSCNATEACFDNAQEAGSVSRVGNGSCNELRSCQFAGDFGGHSDIGNSSCNASFACELAGLFDPNAFSVIGNHSCNGPADMSDPTLPVGICDGNLGTIGNNQRNDP
jgi:hypothetical protein